MTDTEAWRLDVKHWLTKRWKANDSISSAGVSFFGLAFENTRCPDDAWFGVHKSRISLVMGQLYLAAIHKGSREDSGLWLMVDQDPPPIDGVFYKPVIATRASIFPLLWAHSPSLSVIPQVNANDLIWRSFASASEKFLHCRYAANRDGQQAKWHKKRLSEFWVRREPFRLFPDEVEDEPDIREGERRQVTVNAYERDPRARSRCLEHHGRTCFICGFSFGDVYGQGLEGFIHVHHLLPLSEGGSGCERNPVKDLIPVCPNCHAVFHFRKPALSIEEVKALLNSR